MSNSWISFVKEYSDKKKIKYTDAMKSSECKDAYQKQKPKNETPNKKVKMPMMSSPVEAKVRKPRMKKIKETLDKLM